MTSNQRTRLFKMQTKLYAAHKYDNILAAIHKTTVVLKFNKVAFIGMCLFQLIKKLMYELHYDCIENKYGRNQNYYLLTLIV